MALVRQKKEHRAFLSLFEETKDLSLVQETLEVDDDTLKIWRKTIRGFGDKYLSIRGLTKGQDKFVSVFRKKLCNVAATCRAVGIARQTYYRWCDECDIFAHEVELIRESLFDDVESIVYEKVFVDKSENMIQFVAKTQMKHRGYTERTDNVNLNINKNVDSMPQSIEELDKEIRKMEQGKLER